MALKYAEVKFPSDAEENLAKQIAVGHRFLFLDTETIQAIPLACRRFAINLARNGRTIIALPEHGPLQFGDASFHSPLIEAASWLSLTCDRMIYDELNDPINFLVVASKVKTESALVSILEAGKEVDSREVPLNADGVGSLRLQGMPVGEYEAVLRCQKYTQACRFTVARYRLAALTAELESFRMLSEQKSAIERTEVSMSLKTFGQPLTGQLRCDLVEKGKVLISKTVDAFNGKATVVFPFQGSGALSVNLQAEDDASKTATLILQGSSKQDRRETLFSNFSTILGGSMAAAENSQMIRGIHFTSKGNSLCPIKIEPTSRGVRIVSATNMDEIVIQLIDIRDREEGRLTVLRRNDFRMDEVWEIEFDGPACHFGAAAFIDVAPWEQWGYFVKDSSLGAEVELLRPTGEGEPGKVKVSSCNGDYAWLVVKDARLPGAESCSLQLSRNIKDYIERTDCSCDAIEALPGIRLRSFGDALLSRGMISKSQLEDATVLAKEIKADLARALIMRGYISSSQAAQALGEFCNREYVDLRNLEVDESVIELMPETVARESCVLPIFEHAEGTLIVAGSTPLDMDLIANLRFILNRNVEIAVATQDDIVQAINHYYGAMEGESADSILQEFTDTAIDFTSTVEDSVEFCLYDAEPIDRNSRIAIDSEVAKSRSQPIQKIDEPIDGRGDVIFAGLVELKDGVAEVGVELCEQKSEIEVSATIFQGGDDFDWSEVSERFSMMPDSFVELDLPRFVHAKDAAHGRVYFRSCESNAKVTVERDGELVASFEVEANEIPSKETILCVAGRWTARMEMNSGGDSVLVQADVLFPGNSRTVRRPTVLLSPGQTMDFDGSVRKINVLTSFNSPFEDLTRATCNYQHLCCEQTGAKIRSAVFSYLASRSHKVEAINAAQESIIAGVKRLETMWIRGNGFRGYPSRSGPDHVWGRRAVEHLLYVGLLEDLDGCSTAFRRAIHSAVEMSRDVGSLYKSRNHTRFAETAYCTIKFSTKPEEVRDAKLFVRKCVNSGELTAPDASVGKAVWKRSESAYLAAAVFLEPECADVSRAIMLANQVMSDFEESGRLYSTLDSSAAIVMLHEMQNFGAAGDDKECVRLTADGRFIEVNKTCELKNIRTLEAVDAPLIVRMEKIVETSWTNYLGNVPVQVSLLKNGRHELNFGLGEQVDLHVELTEGYKFGDFLDVCLPDSLSRVFGGAQVKQFAVDFRGKSELTIPLVSTGPSFSAEGEAAPHHFSILVRNMYDEDRIACPAFLRVNVKERRQKGIASN